jgi:hypothetical protein
MVCNKEFVDLGDLVQWLKPIILANPEAEMESIVV